jgi:polyisoprenoid-binding protein YceI
MTTRCTTTDREFTVLLQRQLRKYTRLVCWLGALAPAVTTGQTASAPPHAIVLSGTLSFDGHASVGDFTGTTSTVFGEFAGDVVTAHGWVEAPVATLDTHNEHRDRDLRASMESDKYPTLRFELVRTTIVTSGDGPNATSSVVLHGQLAIHGVTRAVELPASTSRVGDTVAVKSTFPLDLNDYRIGGLKKMLGLLRMDPRITVHVDLRFLTSPSLNAVSSTP